MAIIQQIGHGKRNENSKYQHFLKVFNKEGKCILQSNVLSKYGADRVLIGVESTRYDTLKVVDIDGDRYLIDSNIIGMIGLENILENIEEIQ